MVKDYEKKLQAIHDLIRDGQFTTLMDALTSSDASDVARIALARGEKF